MNYLTISINTVLFFGHARKVAMILSIGMMIKHKQHAENVKQNQNE